MAPMDTKLAPGDVWATAPKQNSFSRASLPGFLQQQQSILAGQADERSPKLNTDQASREIFSLARNSPDSFGGREGRMWDAPLGQLLPARPYRTSTSGIGRSKAHVNFMQQPPKRITTDGIGAAGGGEENKSRLLEQFKDTTTRFTTTMSAAMDVDGFYMHQHVQNMLQRNQQPEQRPGRPSIQQLPEMSRASRRSSDAGRNFLVDKLTGREAAAIIIQRAFRAHKNRRVLSKWQSSVGFLKTHIPDRVWNARSIVKNAAHAYSIEIVAQASEDDGEAGAKEGEGRTEEKEAAASTSGRAAGRAVRVIRAFGSFFKPMPAPDPNARVLDRTPAPFHAARAINRANTLPTNQQPPLPESPLDSRLAPVPEPPLTPRGLSPGRLPPGLPLRPSISGACAAPQSPCAAGAPLLSLLELPEAGGPRVQHRIWGSSNTMFVRSSAEGRGSGPELAGSPRAAFLRSEMVERSISSPGCAGLQEALGQGGRQGAASPLGQRAAPPSPKPRSSSSGVPSRYSVVMKVDSSLGPALIASHLVGSAPMAGAGGAKPQAPPTPPQGPPQGGAGRPRRLSLPPMVVSVSPGQAYPQELFQAPAPLPAPALVSPAGGGTRGRVRQW